MKPAELGGIDWASLEHATGSAEDVPGLLEQLRSGDDRVNALFELYALTDVDAGAIYSATPHVARGVIALLADGQVPGKEDLVKFLRALAGACVGASAFVGDEDANEETHRAREVLDALREVSGLLASLGASGDEEVRAEVLALFGEHLEPPDEAVWFEGFASVSDESLRLKVALRAGWFLRAHEERATALLCREPAAAVRAALALACLTPSIQERTPPSNGFVGEATRTLVAALEVEPDLLGDLLAVDEDVRVLVSRFDPQEETFATLFEPLCAALARLDDEDDLAALLGALVERLFEASAELGPRHRRALAVALERGVVESLSEVLENADLGDLASEDVLARRLREP